MHQLSRTLSSEPLVAVQAAASRQTPKASSAWNAPSGAPAASAQGIMDGEVKQFVSQQGSSAGAAPVLQPFLALPASQEAIGQGHCEPGVDPDSAEGQQCLTLASATKAANMQGRNSSAETADVPSCSQPPVQTGAAAQGQLDRQPEGQSDMSAEGQTQEQRALSPQDKGQRPLPKAQTGNVLQQLITRAQKLKEQLDAHAERNANRWMATPGVHLFLASTVCLVFMLFEQKSHV